MAMKLSANDVGRVLVLGSVLAGGVAWAGDVPPGGTGEGPGGGDAVERGGRRGAKKDHYEYLSKERSERTGRSSVDGER